MKFYYILLSFLFSSILLVGQDFEVSPIKLYYNAEPGESQTKYITIKNHSSNVETFILNVNDLSIDSKGISSYADAGSLKNSLADLISISPSFLEINPNEEKEVAIKYSQPTEDYGSKWGVIMVRTAQEQTAYSADKTVSAGMNISARIAVNVYQTPGTNKEYKATITNLSEVSISEKDSIRLFSAVINNLADIITECKVYLIATNLATSEETTLPGSNFTMFPKSSRKLELSMVNNLPKGTYSLAAILDYGSKTNLEGTQIIIKVE